MAAGRRPAGPRRDGSAVRETMATLRFLRSPTDGSSVGPSQRRHTPREPCGPDCANVGARPGRDWPATSIRHAARSHASIPVRIARMRACSARDDVSLPTGTGPPHPAAAGMVASATRSRPAPRRTQLCRARIAHTPRRRDNDQSSNGVSRPAQAERTDAASILDRGVRSATPGAAARDCREPARGRHPFAIGRSVTFTGQSDRSPLRTTLDDVEVLSAAVEGRTLTGISGLGVDAAGAAVWSGVGLR